MSILPYEDYEEVKSEDSDEETDDGSESDQGESFTTAFSSADQWILSEDTLSHPSPATKGSIALLAAGLVFLFRVYVSPPISRFRSPLSTGGLAITTLTPEIEPC
jgi:hypothetical protein